MTAKKMGRPPTGKPRWYVRLPQNLWDAVDASAAKNHRTRDLQIEAILTDWAAAEAVAATVEVRYPAEEVRRARAAKAEEEKSKR